MKNYQVPEFLLSDDVNFVDNIFYDEIKPCENVVSNLKKKTNKYEEMLKEKIKYLEIETGLSQDIEAKTELADKLDSERVELQKKVAELQKDLNIGEDQVLDETEKFKLMLFLYKRNFNIHIDLKKENEHSFTVRLSYFTEMKHPDNNYSILLYRNRILNTWKILDTIPPVKQKDEMSRLLCRTGDVIGMVHTFREVFLRHKSLNKESVLNYCRLPIQS